MQPHTNKEPYTVADIESYHKGTMPAAEMHALEKAALDDPFLSDALDGYVHTKTPTADVAFLRKQIKERSQKIFVLNPAKKRLLLSIAALFILLAGFGWLAFQLSGSHNQDLAKHDAMPQAKEAAPAADSINASPNQTVVATPEQKQESARANEKKDIAAAGETAGTVNQEAAGNRVADAEETFSNTHAAAPSSNTKRTATKPAPQRMFKARVVNERNQPVAQATVVNAQQQFLTTTDAAGNFSIAAPDSNLTVAVNSAGYQQEQRTLAPTDSTTRIVLQSATESLNEVIVTAKGKKITATKRVRLEAVEPLEGESYFNDYVDQNIELPEGFSLPPKDRDVVLSFEVDKSGNAVNVTVEKSLCPACDTTAARLIRDGSKWKKTKQRGKARARIHF